MFCFIKKIFGTSQDRKIKKYRRIVEQVNAEEKRLQALSDAEIKEKSDEFRRRLAAGESVDDLLVEAYAVVKNVCRRLIGSDVHVSGYDQKWDMVPYDVQIVGAIAMHHGSITEMHTGEGKTLTATLPLYLNALTGKPVHLVTVNDYLAKRDCEWVGSILRWLGVTTAALTHDVALEKRKEIYACDVVYGTASEFGFDHLRDNSMAMTQQEQVQRGYYFVIIDEVDSILIDEARTPLIISGPVSVSRQMYHTLKGGVSSLVRMQRDACNKIASDAYKTLKPTIEAAERDSKLPKKNKQEQEDEECALRQMWLVSKGTPRNKMLKRVRENPDLRAALDKWDLYYYADQNKEERKETLSQLYMTIDEKSNDFELTDKGIAIWSSDDADTFVMMDISDEYHKIDSDTTLSDEEKVEKKLHVQEKDAERKEQAHNIRQLLRAHLLMERDVDYIIQEGKIVIIDEHTGRPQPGRRFSDGLHQAIEAKEGVEIQKETQTYATITLQNFFRMYDKLAGMTGTAITEAGEFKQIYKLDVIEVPTHKHCMRQDADDEIYMSEREKYNAILKEVREVHNNGRPILIGTDSVSASEKLSRILKQNHLSHTVLNAKYHEQEAEIIAKAGEAQAITIATNMAGRGTDIKLGAGVADSGGLHVIGTTRHQSRRIDRQLRGRCARQGDPGTSKFFISFEDQLLRLFASPRITAILQKFRPPEGEPISAPILNKSIETAQKRVEQRNYTIRKHTLEYDDVMNKQRQELYEFRNEVLHANDPIEIANELLETVCQEGAAQSLAEEEGGERYRQWLLQHFPVTFDTGVFDDKTNDPVVLATEQILAAFHEKIQREEAGIAAAGTFADALGDEVSAAQHASNAVRDIIIRRMDKRWQEHLLIMDHLRSDVNLRTVGQRDPLMEFKHEAFKLFDELSQSLRGEVAQSLFRFQMILPERHTLDQLLTSLNMEQSRSFLPEESPLPPKKRKGRRAKSTPR